MSPLYIGGTRINKLYVGGTKINRAYVGNTLVYSSEFIGSVTIAIVIRYAGITITDTNCIPAGAEVAMVASVSGTATDVKFSWTRPPNSSAPTGGLTTGTLSWIAAAGDGGTYGVTATSRNSFDNPQTAQETVNIFSYVAPPFTDADANQWITKVELSDCGQLENGVRVAMNDLVLSLKAGGYFGAAKLIAPLIGARNVRSLFPIKAPGSYNIHNELVDASSRYNRKEGLPVTKYSQQTAQAALFSNMTITAEVAAGRVGMANYITSNAANQSLYPSARLLTPLNSWEMYQLNNATFLLPAAFLANYNTGVSNVLAGPVHFGMQFVGTRAAGGTLSTRVNAQVGGAAVPPNALAVPATDSWLSLGLHDLGTISQNPVSRICHAFVILGGGSVDYSSDGLRTIIETYVTAVRAAIP